MKQSLGEVLSSKASRTGSNQGMSCCRPPVKVPWAMGTPKLSKFVHQRFVGIECRYWPSHTSTQTETPSVLLGIKRGAGGAVSLAGAARQSQAFS